MIIFYANGVDITAAVQFGSLSITEQANNRRNTAKFIVNDLAMSEATKVDIYKSSQLSAGISAGVSSFVVGSLLNNDFFRVGDKILLGIRTANEEIVEVDTIDTVTKTISLVSATRYSHIDDDYVGKKLFSGVTLKNPREEIGKSDVLTYSVDCADNSAIFDTHNIVDTYVDMYAREIIGRIAYLFTADDSRVNINDMDALTGITASGVGVTPTLDGTNKVYKNNSVNIGSSAAGSAIYTIAFSALDLSSCDRVRGWMLMPSDISNWVSGVRFRAITSSGNHYEWNDTILEDAVWSYDSFDFSRATITGTPSKASITSIEVTLFATKAIPIGTFKLDHIFACSGGFSIRGVQKGNIFFRDVRAQYKKPTTFVENLSKNDGFSWYVDNDRDIQYFASESRAAPFSIVAPTGTNYGGLKISADITNLKNRQVVRGGIAPSDFTYEQKHVCDGKETSYRLDYPPKTLVVDISTDGGGSWIPKTVGVENLVSETSVDFVFNFSEKTVRNGAISLLAAGTIIRLTYYPYKDVRVQVKDDASITLMKSLLGGDGIFDGAVINDASFRTFDEARARARAELKAYSNPILTATFQTETEGLAVGQVIRITEPTFGIDKDFVVQKIDKKIKDFRGTISHSITTGTTLYGLTEFFQYLLKMTGTGDIDTAELVDNVVAIDETLVISDAITNTIKSSEFYCTPLVPFETLQTGESAYYPLAGNGNDVSGNGNNATPFGNVTYGEDAYGTFADINGDRSYSGGTGTYANLGIGNKMNFTQATDFSWNVAFSLLSSPPNNASGVFGSGFDNALYITNTSGAMTLALRGSTLVTIGVGSNYWLTRYGEVHSIGFAYKASESKFYVYIDGILQNIGGTAGPATFLCNDWSIGDYAYGSGNASSCRKKVYQARVYNKFLSDIDFLYLSKNINFEKGDYFNKNTHFTGNLRFGAYGLSGVSGSSLEQTDYFSDTNSAYSFDGNDLVTQNGFFTGMGQEFTMGVMVYPTSIAAGISNRFLISTNDRLGVAFNTTGKFEAYVYNTTYRVLNITDTPVLNDWTHVGVTYKNNTLKIFLNGVLKGSLAVTGPIVAGTNVYVGNWASLAQGFRGKLDEWEFSTTARDDAGMAELFRRCTTGNDAYADFCTAS